MRIGGIGPPLFRKIATVLCRGCPQLGAQQRPSQSRSELHFGIAVDEKNQELLLTIQDDAAVVAYPKSAQGEEPPIRLLQGEKTLLAAPHRPEVSWHRRMMHWP